MILHTKITTETICKNGSEKYGAKANCKYSTNGKMFIEVSMHGDSKSHARKKLKDFLSSNGNDKIKLIKK